MEKLIAFRTKDMDGDAWCEKAFLFKSDEDVREFFRPDNPKLIELFTDEDDREIRDFEIKESLSGSIVSIHFETEYAGGVILKEMGGGYFVKQSSH